MSDVGDVYSHEVVCGCFAELIIVLGTRASGIRHCVGNAFMTPLGTSCLQSSVWHLDLYQSGLHCPPPKQLPGDIPDLKIVLCTSNFQAYGIMENLAGRTHFHLILLDGVYYCLYRSQSAMGTKEKGGT